MQHLRSLQIVLTTAVLASPPAFCAEDDVDFVRDIKPVLSDRCFLCHGPDSESREANLRLDSANGMDAPLESDGARRAVVPGKPEESELVARIISDDPDVMMPPPDSGLKLTAGEKELLRTWVANGAEWKGHWAFEGIQKPKPPSVANASWCRNPIDHFILSTNEAKGFEQSESTSKERLIRRASFDLTGLPPTLAEIDDFLQDDSPIAFERVVDRLLSSDHFGERMAADWLDVARYSDTYGYQVDRDRFVWPWRDWVVKAFNDNMPYDRFVTEQLAGDLMPDAGREQILATTFNRLHPQKVEGGSVPEEFRVEYVADRAQTVGTAFLGLTFECCRCHDHKYDPLSQREYYQLFSFFNNVDEAGLYSYFTNSVPTPTLRLPTEQQQRSIEEEYARLSAAENYFETVRASISEEPQMRKIIDALLQGAEKRLETPEQLIPDQVAYMDFESEGVGGNVLTNSPFGQAVRLTGDHAVGVKAGNFPRWQPFTISAWINSPREFKRSVVFHRSRAWTDAGSRGYELLIEDGHLSAALIHFWPGNAIRIKATSPLETSTWHHVTITYDGSSKAAGLKLWLDGKILETEILRDNLYKNITGGGGDTIAIGERFRDIGFAGGLVDEFRVFNREISPVEVMHLSDGSSLTNLLKKNLSSLSVSEKRLLAEYFASAFHPAFRSSRDGLRDRREAMFRLQDSLQEIMVMKELPEPRPAYVLTRGAYDAHGESVKADVPAALPAMPDIFPKNRLGLAQWICAPQNPLTARVAANRLWQMCFGHGLVRSPEDFGSQGMQPTHPELLDWLAADFREHGWDVKRFLKQVVMSATYQQSSQPPNEQRTQDPENLYLSHTSVFRLSAEMLRDNSLAVSHLLQKQIGGPPVRPYELAASFKPSTPDKGAGLYRRSLYTYWKRTAPAPMMMTLDASKREVCRVKRERTASPLQALVVMNGPQFVEAARHLAFRMISQHENDDDAILTDMFRLLTSRRPNAEEVAAVRKLLMAQTEHFTKNAGEATKYLAVGETKTTSGNAARLAAWASVANTLFAFDECMMKR